MSTPGSTVTMEQYHGALDQRDATIRALNARLERIRKALIEYDALDHLAHAHTVYEADEDHGGVGDDEVTQDVVQSCADLEYTINWLCPGYVGPSFDADWCSRNGLQFVSSE